MTNGVSKSDWKNFRKLYEVALERLCKRALTDLTDTASDTSISHHDRYLQVFRKIREYDKDIASAFNSLSRSRMMMQLAIMRSLNLVEESEIANFTQQTRDQLKLYDSF